MTPRYPIYIVSKGRWRPNRALTARFLLQEAVPFLVAVEEHEVPWYRRYLPEEVVLPMPFSNLGLGSIPARNFIWEHARERNSGSHWILDDNIGMIRRLWRGRRIPCDSGPAFAATEDFADRYENVGIAGLNYQMFCVPGSPPYRTNVHVYSCLLIRNDLPFRWRGRYNEDTDLCLQALTGGWATILVNAFMVDKKTTMTMKGGNSATLYKGNGRMEMARALERAWPGLATVTKKYGRPQHHVNWRVFEDNPPLRLREGIDLDELPISDEYGLRLRALRPPRSPSIAALLDEEIG